jgi:hypothetical protein
MASRLSGRAFDEAEEADEAELEHLAGSRRGGLSPRYQKQRHERRRAIALIEVAAVGGGGGWTRTNDLRIMRPLLFL